MQQLWSMTVTELFVKYKIEVQSLVWNVFSSANPRITRLT
jgi:hypothetical protein